MTGSIPSIYHTNTARIRDSGGYTYRCLTRFRGYRCTMANRNFCTHRPRWLRVIRIALTPVHIVLPFFSIFSTLLSTAKHHRPERLIGFVAKIHSQNCFSPPLRRKSVVLLFSVSFRCTFERSIDLAKDGSTTLLVSVEFYYIQLFDDPFRPLFIT